MFVLKCLKSYTWELIGFFLLVFCIVINLFPQGYIILGGDILQPINMLQKISFYNYDWSGRVSLFYSLFYVLDSLGVSNTAQISWYLGIFLIGSYFSFLGFSSLLFPRTVGWIRTLVALFYATNLYTLYVFTATWGYSSYQVIYLFIPILTGLFIRALVSRRASYFLLFLLTSFFTSMSFGNPAFLLSLFIFFFILTAFLFLFHYVPWEKKRVFLVLGMSIGALLLNAFWIIPLLPQVKSGIQELYSSQEVNLEERLRKTSNAVMDTVRLLQTSEQERYYPSNFPYPSFQWMEKYIIFMSFAPILFIVFSWSRKREKTERRLYGVFFSLLTLFIILVARIRFPFEPINSFLFTFPGFNALRSYDKLATFVPFILTTLLLMSLTDEYIRKHAKLAASILFFFLIFLALPFYAGGLQTRLSYILSNQKHKDFREASFSALVKVPNSYYALLPTFLADKEMNKISMLPYSAGSSIGRVELPDWKVNGPHIARAIYPKPYIELTEPYIPGWQYAEDFEKTGYNPKWITDFFGLIGVKYILYHHDAKPASLEKFEEHRKYLELVGSLQRVQETTFLTLYQINDSSLFPYIYLTSASNLMVEGTPRGLSEKVSELHASLVPVTFDKKNPKEFSVRINQESTGGSIVLNERTDLLWEATYLSQDGQQKKLERNKDPLYANAWYVDHVSPGDEIRISYQTIHIFFWSALLSGACLILVIGGLLRIFFKRASLK